MAGFEVSTYGRIWVSTEGQVSQVIVLRRHGMVHGDSAPWSGAPGNPDILDFGMTTMTIQVRGRGTLTLPASLREKYRLGEGDPLTVVDLDGAVLLSPRLLVVPRLAAEMERLRRARKLSLKDLGGPARED